MYMLERIGMSKTYGYARVSSKEQHLDRQILRLMPKHLSSEMEKLDDELEKISQSGEKLIDSRYKKEKQNDVITFPGNTLVV